MLGRVGCRSRLGGGRQANYKDTAGEGCGGERKPQPIARALPTPATLAPFLAYSAHALAARASRFQRSCWGTSVGVRAAGSDASPEGRPGAGPDYKLWVGGCAPFRRRAERGLLHCGLRRRFIVSDSLVSGTAHGVPRVAGGLERDARAGVGQAGRRRSVAEPGLQSAGCRCSAVGGEPLYPAPLGPCGPSQAGPRPRVRESPR